MNQVFCPAGAYHMVAAGVPQPLPDTPTGWRKRPSRCIFDVWGDT